MTVIAWDGAILAADKQSMRGEIKQSVTKFSAWGSGSEFAIGAMEMGATAIQAVQATSKHCVSCGFGVDFFDTRELNGAK
jgi:hypothetical protein